MNDVRKIKKFLSVFFIFYPLLSFVPYSYGLTAKEIIKNQDDLMRGDTMQGQYTMTVETSSWSRTLELNVWEKGRDKTLIRITSPAKEAGIGTLRIKQNMWNYLPKVERTIKIPPSMMLQPWMGSDFTNDDLVKESSIVNDYEHFIDAEEVIDGKEVYRIRLQPKPDAAVTWGKLMFWVRKDGYIPVKEEFYNERGDIVKVLEYSTVKDMSGRKIPTVWKIKSHLKEGNETVITIKNVVYNGVISEDVFTQGNLRTVE